MSNLTDFFPAASGGGGGIPKEHKITTSGTLDLTTLGITDGATIHLFLVGGGRSGSAASSSLGGWGGPVYSSSITLGTAGTVTAIIGGASTATSISGGGITGTITTGTSSSNGSLTGSSPGTLPGGCPAELSAYSPGRSSSGSNGYGYSNGSDPSVNKPPQPNTGDGGNWNHSGGSGVIIIFYS